MSQRLNLTNVRFGALVAKLFISGKKSAWLCQCDCGKATTVSTCHLRSGHTTSCGCRKLLPNESAAVHGLRGAPEYRVWASIIQRCTNPNNKGYRLYGGRGIKVCDEWREFSRFISDMGSRPSKDHTIERRNVNGDYCPDNCYWTDDDAIQAFNQNRKANNTSGKSGVYWRKARQKWVALIFPGGRQVRLGSFSKWEDAVAARKAAEVKYYGMEKPDGQMD